MRQVYFDPFGARLEGQRLGQQDEMQLQDQTRRARQSDWQYSNMNPLVLSQAQRQERINAAGEPYAVEDFGLNSRMKQATLFPMEQAGYRELGHITGNYAPAVVNAQSYGARTYADQSMFQPRVAMARDIFDQAPGLSSPDYMTQLGLRYGVDPAAFAQQMQQMPFPLAPQMEQGADSYYNYDRAYQQAVFNAGRQDADWGRQVQQETLNNAAAQQAQSEAWRQWQMQQQIMQQYGANGGYSGAGGLLYGM